MLSDEQVLTVVAPILDAGALEDPDNELDKLDDACSDELAEMEFREQLELFFEEQLPRRCRRARRRALRERR